MRGVFLWSIWKIICHTFYVTWNIWISTENINNDHNTHDYKVQINKTFIDILNRKCSMLMTVNNHHNINTKSLVLFVIHKIIINGKINVLSKNVSNVNYIRRNLLVSMDSICGASDLCFLWDCWCRLADVLQIVAIYHHFCKQFHENWYVSFAD